MSLETPAVPEDLRELWDVWQVLRDDYVDPAALDATTLTRGAIAGLLETLNDPYTIFVEPDQYETQLEDLEGSFEGIGAIISSRNGRVVIVSPLRRSPAERAGLRPGDVILTVDGEPTEGMTVAQVVERIRGDSGTTVILRVESGSSASPREVSIVRALVMVPTVEAELLPDDVAHITLASFSSQTDKDLRRELERLRPSRLSGIVLDLRNNPGGLLTTAVAVASEFLDDGVVLYEVDRSGDETAHQVRPAGTALGVPLVVLVNVGSASASEIVAGALQARGRARLMGETTFGKGSVTLLKQLSTGAGLYVTTTRWLTPDRQPIEGVGLTPDLYALDDPSTEVDEALQRAIVELRQ